MFMLRYIINDDAHFTRTIGHFFPAYFSLPYYWVLITVSLRKKLRTHLLVLNLLIFQVIYLSAHPKLLTLLRVITQGRTFPSIHWVRSERRGSYLWIERRTEVQTPVGLLQGTVRSTNRKDLNLEQFCWVERAKLSHSVCIKALKQFPECNCCVMDLCYQLSLWWRTSRLTGHLPSLQSRALHQLTKRLHMLWIGPNKD